jgi:hypothetical protein
MPNTLLVNLGVIACVLVALLVLQNPLAMLGLMMLQQVQPDYPEQTADPVGHIGFVQTDGDDFEQ